jgi:hypothetical protein
MSAIKEAVTDAVATMKHAERVIDGLMVANARLRRENFAMLEALENMLAAFEQNGWHKQAPETYRFAENASRLAKGVAL